VAKLKKRFLTAPLDPTADRDFTAPQKMHNRHRASGPKHIRKAVICIPPEELRNAHGLVIFSTARAGM
jgi:hypothetical protein